MKLTQALKKHAEGSLGVAPGASDEVYETNICTAIRQGSLTAEKFSELATSVAENGAVEKKVDPWDRLGSVIDKAIEKRLGGQSPPAPAAPPPENKPSEMETLIEKSVEKAMASRAGYSGVLSPDALIAAAPSSNPRVKSVIERFDRSRKGATYPMVLKSGATHPLGGQQVRFGNRDLNISSQADKAVNAAILKWNVFVANFGAAIAEGMLSQQEKDLRAYAMHELDWTGYVGGDGEHGGLPINERRLTDYEMKALLNDATSGGSYAIPFILDQDVVLTPVLDNEIFPFVEVENLPMGNTVYGVSMVNPTLVSNGGPEGTAFSEQTTAGMIGQLTVTIYPVVFAVELGLDWQQDTPINWSQLIIQQLGLKLGEWLDRVVLTGQSSSANEPLGIFNTPAIGSVSASAASAGPLTVGDAHNLIFAIAKATRKAKGSWSTRRARDSRSPQAASLP